MSRWPASPWPSAMFAQASQSRSIAAYGTSLASSSSAISAATLDLPVPYAPHSRTASGCSLAIGGSMRPIARCQPHRRGAQIFDHAGVGLLSQVVGRAQHGRRMDRGEDWPKARLDDLAVLARHAEVAAEQGLRRGRPEA